MNRTSNATSSVPHNGTTFSNTTHVFNATQAHMQALNRESKSLNIELLKVTIAFIIIMLVGYLLRVISRATMVKKFTREDWMMMFAMVSNRSIIQNRITKLMNVVVDWPGSWSDNASTMWRNKSTTWWKSSSQET